ncbi:MAG: hypothetical protein FWG31_00215 [Oscillospiraceae bacterium]|nr:hypothetical protein [Oscillospiraceae bacterium]
MKTTQIPPHKSSLGMDANITVLIVFLGMILFGWIPYVSWIAFAVPLVFFILEKESKMVKFYCVNALIIGVVWSVISIIMQILRIATGPKYESYFGIRVPVTLGNSAVWWTTFLIEMLIGLAITGLVAYLLYCAWNYKQVEVPVIGPIAAKVSGKLDNMSANFNQSQQQPSQPQPQPEPQQPQPPQAAPPSDGEGAP